jgi:hypothetical protein
LQATHRPDHLAEAAGMEQVAIEVMGIAMVTQIEAHHIEATLEQRLCQR